MAKGAQDLPAGMGGDATGNSVIDMLKQAAAATPQATIFQKLQDGGLGKKKGPKTPATPTTPAPLADPTWAGSKLDPAARSQLLMAMMNRSREMSGRPAAPAAPSSKGAQTPPNGGA